MQKRIINFAEFSYSRELLEAKTPNFIRFFIILVLVIFIITLVWIFFAEIEIIVKATAIIRPIQSSSIVRNPKSGLVKKINFYEGKRVEKGDLLYDLDTSMLKQKQKKIEKELQKYKKELIKLKNLKKGITNSKNFFTDKEFFFYHRYLVYIGKYQQFDIEHERILNRYLQEKNLMTTTKQRLKELEIELKYAKLNRDMFKTETKLNITKEINNKEKKIIQLQQSLIEITNEINLARVEAAITGEVHVYYSLNKGDFMPQGLEVLRISPVTKEDLKVELTVRNKDISLLKEKQEVNYRFLSLPHREYGNITGQITQIASDVRKDSTKEELNYHVVASLNEQQVVNKQGKITSLKTGMLGEARIIVHSRKILYIVLEKLDFIS